MADSRLPPGFAVYWHVRNRDITGQSRCGGVCFLINKNRCTDVRIISQGRTFNLEFIAIKFRPFYLARDFSTVRLTAVYIHPRADTNTAVEDLHSTIFMCENDDPNTLSIVAGHFSQANLEGILPEYRQYVTCPSLNNGMLDHCHCKVKKLINQCHVHVTVMLVPIYKQR